MKSHRVLEKVSKFVRKIVQKQKNVINRKFSGMMMNLEFISRVRHDFFILSEYEALSLVKYIPFSTSKD